MTMTGARCYNRTVRKNEMLLLRQNERIYMIAFINSFLSYLLLFVVMGAVAGLAIFVGITMRKRKNAAAEEVTEQQE